MSQDEQQQVRKNFDEAINMSPSDLEKWLGTDGSRSVGQKDGGGESTGHASGRRIIEIKRKNKDDLTESDYAHMEKAAGYVKRHLAQRPDGDISETPWRYSLMNWGHDPQS
ncbi:DUF3140 domain-containing protein [Pedococcus sp. 2YAF34]|uniref:DUF3140 domain-containing protein n=1 Tax=Pedococcus sp. 2YAF34 TaxID=3233032 RepID=UPI003F984930